MEKTRGIGRLWDFLVEKSQSTETTEIDKINTVYHEREKEKERESKVEKVIRKVIQG